MIPPRKAVSELLHSLHIMKQRNAYIVLLKVGMSKRRTQVHGASLDILGSELKKLQSLPAVSLVPAEGACSVCLEAGSPCHSNVCWKSCFSPLVHNNDLFLESHTEVFSWLSSAPDWNPISNTLQLTEPPAENILELRHRKLYFCSCIWLSGAARCIQEHWIWGGESWGDSL